MRPRRWRPPRPGRAAICASHVEKFESSLTSYLHTEAVFQRELQPEIADRETVGEVFAVDPLKLAAHHHVLRRSTEQVDERVLAVLERVRRLGVAVGDVHARVAYGAGEPVVPRVVEEE